MIAIDSKLYSDMLQLLDAIEAQKLATRLRTAAIESATRELDFDDAPTFCRPQAGM
jgi:hypothetical protein